MVKQGTSKKDVERSVRAQVLSDHLPPPNIVPFLLRLTNSRNNNKTINSKIVIQLLKSVEKASRFLWRILKRGQKTSRAANWQKCLHEVRVPLSLRLFWAAKESFCATAANIQFLIFHLMNSTAFCRLSFSPHVLSLPLCAIFWVLVDFGLNMECVKQIKITNFAEMAVTHNWTQNLLIQNIQKKFGNSLKNSYLKEKWRLEKSAKSVNLRRSSAVYVWWKLIWLEWAQFGAAEKYVLG